MIASEFSELILSEAEIETRYPNTHVLVEVLEHDAAFRVVRGRVLCTGDNRTEVWDISPHLPGQNPLATRAVISTEKAPEDMQFLL